MKSLGINNNSGFDKNLRINKNLEINLKSILVFLQTLSSTKMLIDLNVFNMTIRGNDIQLNYTIIVFLLFILFSTLSFSSQLQLRLKLIKIVCNKRSQRMISTLIIISMHE